MTGEKNRILTECDALFLRTYVSEKHAALQLQDGPRRFGNAVTMNTATCLSVTVAGDIRVSLGCPRVQSSVEDQNECGALVEWCFGGGDEAFGEKPVPFSLYRPKISHVFIQACLFDTRSWRWVWDVGRLILTGEIWSAGSKNCPIVTLITTNFTSTGPGSRPGLCSCTPEPRHGLLFLKFITIMYTDWVSAWQKHDPFPLQIPADVYRNNRSLMRESYGTHIYSAIKKQIIQSPCFTPYLLRSWKSGLK